jgi:hypothetical protein
MDSAARLDQLVDAYFEELLKLNPLLATFIGDPRYNDQLPNSLGPEHRALVRATNARYLAAARQIDAAQLPASKLITHEIFVRTDAPRKASDLITCCRQTGRWPADDDGRARCRRQRAAVRDAQGLRGPARRIDGFVVRIDQAVANMREGSRAASCSRRSSCRRSCRVER